MYDLLFVVVRPIYFFNYTVRVCFFFCLKPSKGQNEKKR